MTNLKSPLFCVVAILFVVGAAAELAGDRGKITIINGRGEAGHDLVVEAEEEKVKKNLQRKDSKYYNFI